MPVRCTWGLRGRVATKSLCSCLMCNCVLKPHISFSRVHTQTERNAHVEKSMQVTYFGRKEGKRNKNIYTKHMALVLGSFSVSPFSFSFLSNPNRCNVPNGLCHYIECVCEYRCRWSASLLRTNVNNIWHGHSFSVSSSASYIFEFIYYLFLYLVPEKSLCI